jgi:hypothetical protein
MGQLLGRLIAASGMMWLAWLFLAACAVVLVLLAYAVVRYWIVAPILWLLRASRAR